jgi:hypothetical protein
MAVRAAPQRPGRVLRPEALPAPRPHLRVVPPDYLTARARQRRARRLVVLGGVAAAALLFGIVAFHVVLTQSQLNIQHLQTRAQSSALREQQLRLEAARLESPERIVDDAKRLGMVSPASVRYLTPASDAPVPPPAATTTPATAPKRLVTAAPRPATPRPSPVTSKTAAKPAARTTPTTTAVHAVTTPPQTHTTAARPTP